MTRLLASVKGQAGKRGSTACRQRLKCDGTLAETIFLLLAKRASPFKSAGASVQSTTGSRGVRISGSNAGYTMFRGSVKGTGYPLHSPVSPTLSLPCVNVCHHISTGVYHGRMASTNRLRVRVVVFEVLTPRIVAFGFLCFEGKYCMIRHLYA